MIMKKIIRLQGSGPRGRSQTIMVSRHIHSTVQGVPKYLLKFGAYKTLSLDAFT